MNRSTPKNSIAASLRTGRGIVAQAKDALLRNMFKRTLCYLVKPKRKVDEK